MILAKQPFSWKERLMLSVTQQDYGHFWSPGLVKKLLSFRKSWWGRALQLHKLVCRCKRTDVKNFQGTKKPTSQSRISEQESPINFLQKGFLPPPPHQQKGDLDTSIIFFEGGIYWKKWTVLLEKFPKEIYFTILGKKVFSRLPPPHTHLILWMFPKLQTVVQVHSFWEWSS